MSVDKPNYTQIPNLLLDDFMADMDGSELKVTLAIARQTFGYHRDRHNLSIAELQKMTGLSKQGVVNGIDAGMKRGLITRSDGKRGGFVYEINVDPTSQINGHVKKVDMSTCQINGQEPVKIVDITSQISRQELVKIVDSATPTLKKEKETLKETDKEMGEDHLLSIILVELSRELAAHSPAHEWLKGCRLQKVSEIVYHLHVLDAKGADWLSQQLAVQIGKKLSVLVKRRVDLEIVCTEMEVMA